MHKVRMQVKGRGLLKSVHVRTKWEGVKVLVRTYFMHGPLQEEILVDGKNCIILQNLIWWKVVEIHGKATLRV